MKINWFKIKINFSTLSTLISQAHPNQYSIFSIYLKQGSWCKDCKNNFHNCKCNKCYICKFNNCLCSLNIKNLFSYQSSEEYTLIRNLMIYWCKYNLSFKNLKILEKMCIGNLIINRSITQNEMMNISKSIKESWKII